MVYARFHGEIDPSNAAALRDEITRAIANHALGLVLDLSEVHYLSSAGIHLIHHLREDLHARGQTLALVVPEESVVHDILALAGLDWHEEINDTTEAARRMFGHGPKSISDPDPQ
jgi:anti-anti-sigma factor